jgi:spore coat polysaccharide biosynthesis protein SpsF
VLERFIQAAEQFGFGKIVRICADNPFLDIFALEQLISQMEESESDYWCFSTGENLPTIRTHYGFWAEGVSLPALKKIRDLTGEPLYLEHVTNYIYTHPGSFRIISTPIDPMVDSEKRVRLTVDTEADFELSKTIYDHVVRQGIPVEARSLVSYIRSFPGWIRIMEREILKNTK